MKEMRNTNWNPDELLLAAELVYKNGFRGLDDSDPRVQELSKILRSVSLRGNVEMPSSHRSPASVALKTQNIASTHPGWRKAPTNSGRLDRPALDRFLNDPESALLEAQRVRELFSKGGSVVGDTVPDLDMGELQADEGKILMASHLRRERDSRLRNAKLDKARSTGTPIACEVCSFDFSLAYGDRGEGYIEVHHVLPLHASGPVKTKLEDLVLLCSNCHRMMHRRGWITPTELKQIMELQATRSRS